MLLCNVLQLPHHPQESHVLYSVTSENKQKYLFSHLLSANFYHIALSIIRGKLYKFLGYYHCMYFPGGSDGKASVYDAEDPGSIPGSEDPLEKATAIHSSTIAWKIPWTEEPGGL